MPTIIAPQSRSALRAAFAAGGTRAALSYLNSGTGFRFTSVYRFHADMLRAVCVFDRENPDESILPPDVPLSATYCLFQKVGGRFIRIDDALEDPALATHPARSEVRSYIGVPLRTIGGQVIGSACHFSLAPHREDADIELLETLSDLLAFPLDR